jgi:plastocyanin
MRRLDRKAAIRKALLISIFLLVLLVAGFGISCQSAEPAPPATEPGLPREPSPGAQPTALPQIEVAIEGFAFEPAEIIVAVGTTVIWYNNDPVTHTVTARDGLFDSGGISEGETFNYTFEETGAFEYYCIPHPYMTGKVTVK